MTFNSTDVLGGWPARADYPDEESLYEARSQWLNDNPDYVKGLAIPDPLYDDFASSPVNNDVRVVQLDERVEMSTYGVLAPLGTAETLASPPNHRNDALVEMVGYGIQSVQPKPMDEATRFKSTSRVVEVNGSISRAATSIRSTTRAPSVAGADRVSGTRAARCCSTTPTK